MGINENDFFINQNDFLNDKFDFLSCEPSTYTKSFKRFNELSSSDNKFVPVRIEDPTTHELIGIGFQWNGQVIWTIEKKFFIKKPDEVNKPPTELTITLTPNPDHEWDYLVELNNALFPGTNLSADFKCKLKKNR